MVKPMDHYSFIEYDIVRSTSVSLKFQLICLELVSDSTSQTTAAHINGTE